MAGRSEDLADRFEEAVEEFISVVEPLAEEQWRVICPTEERSIGVLTRHVAKGIPFEMVVFRQIAAGVQPAMITRAHLAEMNAADADEWADCSKDETLALLRKNAASAAAEVRQLSDSQLSRSSKYIEELPEPWTVDQWLERILIGHVNGHLQSIRETLAVRTTA